MSTAFSLRLVSQAGETVENAELCCLVCPVEFYEYVVPVYFHFRSVKVDEQVKINLRVQEYIQYGLTSVI